MKLKKLKNMGGFLESYIKVSFSIIYMNEKGMTLNEKIIIKNY